MKKLLKIALVLGLLIAIGIGVYFKFFHTTENSENVAYVSPVRMINVAAGMNTENRFSGVVESQQTISFKKDGNREIEEIFVTEGQEVKNGDVLFRYEVHSAENKIAQEYLEIEGMRQMLEYLYNNQSTSSQIQARQTEIEIKKSEADIASYQQEIDNAEVKTTISGIVKKVNANTEDFNEPIIEVMEIGDYRVKGKVDEQNIHTLYVGMPITIRSRIDETKTWTGTLSKIETEPESNNNNGGHFYGEEGEKVSNYPFYVTLETVDGLMLGQHVFIEAGEVGPSLQGIWIMPEYLFEENGVHYAWVSENGKLKKRKVTTGEFDESYYATEITSGLENSDLIAWPDESFKEGMSAIDMSSMENMGIEE